MILIFRSKDKSPLRKSEELLHHGSYQFTIILRNGYTRRRVKYMAALKSKCVSLEQIKHLGGGGILRFEILTWDPRK